MVRSTIALETEIRDANAPRGFDRSLPTQTTESSSGAPDGWWEAVRRSVGRSLDTDRLEETLRLRQQQPGE